MGPAGLTAQFDSAINHGVGQIAVGNHTSLTQDLEIQNMAGERGCGRKGERKREHGFRDIRE
jgi:hypothetical protein